MEAGSPEAQISECYKFEGQNATAAQMWIIKSPFTLISWKQWTGPTVSCTAGARIRTNDGEEFKNGLDDISTFCQPSSAVLECDNANLQWSGRFTVACSLFGCFFSVGVSVMLYLWRLTAELKLPWSCDIWLRVGNNSFVKLSIFLWSPEEFLFRWNVLSHKWIN